MVDHIRDGFTSLEGRCKHPAQQLVSDAAAQKTTQATELTVHQTVVRPSVLSRSTRANPGWSSRGVRVTAPS